jgi:hypothetical protein
MLKHLVLHHFASYSAQIYLFGSYARGTARSSSDVDTCRKSLWKITPFFDGIRTLDFNHCSPVMIIQEPIVLLLMG